MKTKLNEIKRLQKLAGLKENQEAPKFDKSDLQLGKNYSVLDNGMDEWVEDYEYLGFDVNTREHVFRMFDGHEFRFVMIPDSELATDVKEEE